MENIDLVNFFRCDNPHSPCHSITLNDLSQLLALLGRKLFRVIEQRIVVVTRQDDGGRVDAACQATATSLVTTGLNAICIIMWKHLYQNILRTRSIPATSVSISSLVL